LTSREIGELQQDVCRRFRAQFDPVTEDMTVGIALNVRGTTEHINGLRHRPEGHTAGWYIWAGQEFSEAGDFFKPLHVTHLKNWCPQVLKYLALPPGWRFLVARNYEDVWFDPSLLAV